MNHLYQKLISLRSCSDQEAMLLIKEFKEIHLRKGHILLAAGQIPRHLYFIQQGYIRGYFVYDFEEFTSRVLTGGMFLFSPGLCFKRSGEEYIECLSDAEVSFLDIDQSAGDNKSISIILNRVLQEILDETLLAAEYTQKMLHIHDGIARYRYFVEKFPRLTGNVNNDILASLLRLRPAQFKRIKRS